MDELSLVNNSGQDDPEDDVLLENVGRTQLSSSEILCDDVLCLVLGYLSIKDWRTCLAVSKQFYRLLTTFPEFRNHPYHQRTVSNYLSLLNMLTPPVTKASNQTLSVGTSRLLWYSSDFSWFRECETFGNLTSYNLTHIKILGLPIKSLKGLETQNNLIELNLNRCTVADISALAHCSKLERVHLESTHITTLDSLRHLPVLTMLSIKKCSKLSLTEIETFVGFRLTKNTTRTAQREKYACCICYF